MARFNNAAATAGQGAQTQVEKPSFQVKNLTVTARFLFFTGVGFLTLLNVQPWLELSRQISKQITTIPFLDSLTSIPFLGGWIEWIVANIVSILGFVLWGIIQYIELLPMFAEGTGVWKQLSNYRWMAYAVEFAVCFLRFPPYEGGMAAILEDSPNWDANLIDYWNLILFVVTMFGFELCFRVIATVLQGLRK